MNGGKGHSLVQKVRREIREKGLFQPGEKVLAAVSGGADSMALLRALWEIRAEMELSLAVFHLDHGLRPEGREEAAFVERAARELKVPFIEARADGAEFRKGERRNLQEAARELRYGLLREAAREQGAAKVALGHTADDQAESVLLRLIRGAGPRGLGGIPAQREGLFVRPLLTVWRQEVESYLKECGLSFLNDPTNLSDRFLRNRIRRELLPLLAGYNPRIKQTLVKTAEIFRAEEECWQGLLPPVFSSCLKAQGPDFLSLDVSSLGRQALPLRLRCLRHALEIVAGSLRGIGAAHILAIEGIRQGSAPNKNVNLPYHLSVVKEYESLIFYRQKRESKSFLLSVPGLGEVAIPEIGRRMRFSLAPEKKDGPLYDPPGVAHLDFSSIPFPLTIRSFHPGDRFLPLGLGGQKKVKDLFIDRKIPPEQRRRIPLLFKDDHLLWVAGLQIDHRVRIRPETSSILRVEFF